MKLTPKGSRRIAKNQRKATKRETLKTLGLMKEFKHDPCFVAGFSTTDAPHGPKCICLVREAAMLFIRHLIGSHIPNLPKGT